ncbi:hypothetical protein [Nesterenkonia sp. NBAIMH1]|uniref:hypothetical protein n=1 Tax=Nesterenkonia sp. NBAIMH1 TaxID=2600320 RepID=UPI0011B68A6B|nr:hypothetical protein [Nesterenkonia sp. NBAIMH1]
MGQLLRHMLGGPRVAEDPERLPLTVGDLAEQLLAQLPLGASSEVGREHGDDAGVGQLPHQLAGLSAGGGGMHGDALVLHDGREGSVAVELGAAQRVGAGLALVHELHRRGGERAEDQKDDPELSAGEGAPRRGAQAHGGGSGCCHCGATSLGPEAAAAGSAAASSSSSCRRASYCSRLSVPPRRGSG